MSDLGKLFTTVKVDLLAADVTRELVADPGDGSYIRVFRILYISNTSASETLSVDAGTVNYLNLAIDISAHVIIDTGWLDGGILGQASEALDATPGAAGPAGSFYVTYVIE